MKIQQKLKVSQGEKRIAKITQKKEQTNSFSFSFWSCHIIMSTYSHSICIVWQKLCIMKHFSHWLCCYLALWFVWSVSRSPWEWHICQAWHWSCRCWRDWQKSALLAPRCTCSPVPFCVCHTCRGTVRWLRVHRADRLEESGCFLSLFQHKQHC